MSEQQPERGHVPPSSLTEDDLAGVPEGWRDLVRELDQQLRVLTPGYTLDQAKQKFGGLRYYVSFPEWVSEDAQNTAIGLIDLAQVTSTTLCEVCGRSGSVFERNRWLRTLCTEHAEGGQE